jgi:hypothetical protein
MTKGRSQHTTEVHAGPNIQQKYIRISTFSAWVPLKRLISQLKAKSVSSCLVFLQSHYSQLKYTEHRQIEDQTVFDPGRWRSQVHVSHDLDSGCWRCQDLCIFTFHLNVCLQRLRKQSYNEWFFAGKHSRNICHDDLFVLFWVARAIFQLSGDCHHYRWQGCKFRPMLSAYGF